MVDARDEEGGGTPGLEAVGFNAFGGDVGEMVDGGSSVTEFSGDVVGGDIVWPAGGCVGPLLHVMQGAVVGRNALDKGTTEGSVSQVERLAAATVSSGREGVLAWAAEEEESEGGQVKDGLGSGLVMVLGKAGDEGMKDGDVDWPHLGGGGVLISPGLEEGLEMEGVMDTIQVGIQEAQLGELLAHSM